jgi:hypothetical protein
VDTGKGAIIAQFPLHVDKGNETLTLDEANHRLLIGLRAKPRLAVLDSETGKEVASVPIPEGVDDVSLDAQRKLIYASCREGFIAVIRQRDADHYEPVAKIATIKGAKTSAFDPDSGRLYLAVPRQEGKSGPEVWVYQARP